MNDFGNWQPIKTWDTYAHLPIAQDDNNPSMKTANEAQRILNRTQDCFTNRFLPSGGVLFDNYYPEEIND